MNMLKVSLVGFTMVFVLSGCENLNKYGPFGKDRFILMNTQICSIEGENKPNKLLGKLSNDATLYVAYNNPQFNVDKRAWYNLNSHFKTDAKSKFNIEFLKVLTQAIDTMSKFNNVSIVENLVIDSLVSEKVGKKKIIVPSPKLQGNPSFRETDYILLIDSLNLNVGSGLTELDYANISFNFLLKRVKDNSVVHIGYVNTSRTIGSGSQNFGEEHNIWFIFAYGVSIDIFKNSSLYYNPYEIRTGSRMSNKYQIMPD